MSVFDYIINVGGAEDANNADDVAAANDKNSSKSIAIAPDFSKIDARAKEYEMACVSHDPFAPWLLEAIKIVKEFIRERELVLYGGTCIDYLLRLVGDKIYPDDLLAFPDLDFLSPNSVADAYDLADILYRAGFADARAIKAIHVTTMKVDAGDNHFVADISYVPPSIFAKFDTIVYEGMKCLTADLQRLDLHSSLAFPFENPPRETIFDRWSKDIKRFNKLKKYPLKTRADSDAKSVDLKESLVMTELAHGSYVISGMHAYAIFYAEYVKLGLDVTGIIPLKLEIKPSSIIAETLAPAPLRSGTIHIIVTDIEKFPAVTRCVYYRPTFNIYPSYYRGFYEKAQLIAFDMKHKQLSINSIQLGEKKYRLCCVQWLLKQFIGEIFIASSSTATSMPVTAQIYTNLYNSLLTMIERAPTSGIFGLTINTFGSENISHSYELMRNNILSEISDEPKINVPANWRVASGMPKPKYDYNCDFYRDDGSEVRTE